MHVAHTFTARRATLLPHRYAVTWFVTPRCGLLPHVLPHRFGLFAVTVPFATVTVPVAVIHILRTTRTCSFRLVLPVRLPFCVLRAHAPRFGSADYAHHRLRVTAGLPYPLRWFPQRTHFVTVPVTCGYMFVGCYAVIRIPTLPDAFPFLRLYVVTALRSAVTGFCLPDLPRLYHVYHTYPRLCLSRGCGCYTLVTTPHLPTFTHTGYTVTLHTLRAHRTTLPPATRTLLVALLPRTCRARLVAAWFCPLPAGCCVLPACGSGLPTGLHNDHRISFTFCHGSVRTLVTVGLLPCGYLPRFAWFWLRFFWLPFAVYVYAHAALRLHLPAWLHTLPRFTDYLHAFVATVYALLHGSPTVLTHRFAIPCHRRGCILVWLPCVTFALLLVWLHVSPHLDCLPAVTVPGWFGSFCGCGYVLCAVRYGYATGSAHTTRYTCVYVLRSHTRCVCLLRIWFRSATVASCTRYTTVTFVPTVHSYSSGLVRVALRYLVTLLRTARLTLPPTCRYRSAPATLLHGCYTTFGYRFRLYGYTCPVAFIHHYRTTVHAYACGWFAVIPFVLPVVPVLPPHCRWFGS